MQLSFLLDGAESCDLEFKLILNLCSRQVNLSSLGLPEPVLCLASSNRGIGWAEITYLPNIILNSTKKQENVILKLGSFWEWCNCKNFYLGFQDVSSRKTHSSFIGYLDFSGGLDGKESACNTGDRDSIPGSVRSLGDKDGNPLQCSCLGNPMDRGLWPATVNGVPRVGHELATKEVTS